MDDLEEAGGKSAGYHVAEATQMTTQPTLLTLPTATRTGRGRVSKAHPGTMSTSGHSPSEMQVPGPKPPWGDLQSLPLQSPYAVKVRTRGTPAKRRPQRLTRGADCLDLNGRPEGVPADVHGAAGFGSGDIGTIAVLA